MVIYSHNWEQEYSSTAVSLDQKTCNSDEEVLLASSCPKKRAGRKKFKETRHPVYRGIRRRNNNRWVCEVRAPNNKTRIWLGTYPTAEMAARAHDVAVLALRGRMACLNFADSATRLRIPASGDIRDIQRVAAEAAEEFRPERESVQENTKEYEEIMQENSSEVTEVGYMDEEATFHMPKLLTHMAEGMLVSPPHHTVFQDFGWDDTEGESEVSLWSYSI